MKLLLKLRVEMVYSKWLLLCCLCLGFCVQVSASAEQGFSQIYKSIESTNGQTYLLTNNGTWLVDQKTLTRVDSTEKIQLYTQDYQQLIANIHAEPKSLLQKLVGVSYIFVAVIFVIVYLYYQSSLNKRRRSYYERIKVQQQILNIASLATGDEVLDCDIVNNTVNRINKNATVGLSDEIYFQSESFIRSLHPDDKSIFLGHFKSLIHGGKNNYQIEYRISDSANGWIWLVERGCVIERDDNGRAKRLVSSMRDISSIKQEHENLIRLISELERRLKTAEAALANS